MSHWPVLGFAYLCLSVWLVLLASTLAMLPFKPHGGSHFVWMVPGFGVIDCTRSTDTLFHLSTFTGFLGQGRNDEALCLYFPGIKLTQFTSAQLCSRLSFSLQRTRLQVDLLTASQDIKKNTSSTMADDRRKSKVHDVLCFTLGVLAYIPILCWPTPFIFLCEMVRLAVESLWRCMGSSRAGWLGTGLGVLRWQLAWAHVPVCTCLMQIHYSQGWMGGRKREWANTLLWVYNICYHGIIFLSFLRLWLTFSRQGRHCCNDLVLTFGIILIVQK